MTELPRVKICGITRYEDARIALEEGAWAVGFVFHRPSRRYIEPDSAKRIVSALAADTRTVGVFVDDPIDEVQHIVDHVGLAGAQLHGSESPEEIAAIEVALKIKAFRVGARFDPTRVDDYPDALVLLDAYRPGLAGGTGSTFDWRVARAIAERRPTILAGGLGVDNLSRAIKEVQPYALDLSSNLEESPGVKDPAKLRELFSKLRAGL